VIGEGQPTLKGSSSSEPYLELIGFIYPYRPGGGNNVSLLCFFSEQSVIID